MSRTLREAKMKALLGEKGYQHHLVTELGGRKRDRKKRVKDELERAYREGSLPEYQEGNVPAYARSPIIDATRDTTPIHRKVMNALPTLAGLGLGLARGATFGPGPDDTIVAQYPDETGQVDPQTLGEVMLLPEGRTGDAVKTHELGHVAQGKYFGPLLPAMAAGMSGIQALRGRDPYLESPLETSALEMGRAEERGESTAPPLLEAILQEVRGKR